LTILQLKTHL